MYLICCAIVVVVYSYLLQYVEAFFVVWNAKVWDLIWAVFRVFAKLVNCIVSYGGVKFIE